MEGPILRGHKWRRGQDGEKIGASGSGSTSFALAGSWVTLQELTSAKLVLALHSRLEDADEDVAWKITTERLRQRLAEQAC